MFEGWRRSGGILLCVNAILRRLFGYYHDVCQLLNFRGRIFLVSLTPSDFQCMFRIGPTYVQTCRKESTCWCKGTCTLCLLSYPASIFRFLPDLFLTQGLGLCSHLDLCGPLDPCYHWFLHLLSCWPQQGQIHRSKSHLQMGGCWYAPSPKRG